jgi:hypothetical protein
MIADFVSGRGDAAGDIRQPFDVSADLKKSRTQLLGFQIIQKVRGRWAWAIVKGKSDCLAVFRPAVYGWGEPCGGLASDCPGHQAGPA